jgi:hypothetical protein
VKDGQCFDIHGAMTVRLVGDDPVCHEVGRALDFFKSPSKDADLTIVLGEFPGSQWEPAGTLVGDRFLFDPARGVTTVLSNRAGGRPMKSDAEYVMIGDFWSPGEPVTIYIPKTRRPISPFGSFRTGLRHGHLRRGFLGLAGNPLGMRHVVRQAEKITEAILEPFLFYRLPERGMSLVHAASVSQQDGATLLGGSANIGKSTFALRCARDKMAFLGDTFVILTEGGEILAYPGLVKLNPGHLSTFPELAIRLAAGLGPIGRYLLRSELSDSPGEALESLPQRQMTELFEGVVIAKRARLKDAILLNRETIAEAKTYEIDNDRLATALSLELYWEFESAPWRNNQFIFAPSAAAGKSLARETTENHAKVEDVLRRGLSKAMCHGVTLPFGTPIEMMERVVPGLLTKG